MNDTRTGSGLTVARFWTISGVCRCPPPTPYAVAEPMTSEPSRWGLAARPAPEVPEKATMLMSGRTSPAATAGKDARVLAVG